MEDERLRHIFKEFNPEINPDYIFMNDLNKKIKAIEVVKESNIALRKNIRYASIIGISAGFLAGVLFMIALPWINRLWSSFSIPDSFILFNIPFEFSGNLIICMIGVIFSLSITISSYLIASRNLR